jgi:predicted amidohydrolase
MRDLRITLVQANQIWEDKQANLRHYEQLISGVSTDLIVFPEMFHTGFSMNPEKLAEKMTDSQGLAWLKRIAAEKNAACFTSLIVEENNCFYNRGVFVEPAGKITVYDKRKCFGLAGEDLIFTAGKNTAIVAYNGWKINLQICYDLRFPVFARNVENYDLLLYVANWPKPRINAWDALLKARAIENMCYTIGVNRIGEDANQLEYPGHSKVIDYLGDTMVDCENELGVFIFELDKNNQQEAREKFNFLYDRDDFEIR